MGLVLPKNRLTQSSDGSSLESRVMLMGTRTVQIQAETFTEVYTADTGDEKAESRYRKDGNRENFQVAEGENKEPNGLDPRAESAFTKRVKKTAGLDFTFTGEYNIKSAKDTTVFQILNIDKNDSNDDTARPVVFIEAETYKKDGKPKVRLFEKNAKSKGAIYDGDRKFDLKIETNGRQADIFVDGKKRGKTVIFDRYRSRPGIQLGDNNNTNEIRYGAYHHDNRTIPSDERKDAKGTADERVTLEAASKANIDVTNAQLVREAYTVRR